MFEDSEILSDKFSQLLDKWSTHPRVKDYRELDQFIRANTTDKDWEKKGLRIKAEMFTHENPMFELAKKLFNEYSTSGLKGAYYDFSDLMHSSVKNRWRDLVEGHHRSKKGSKAYDEWIKKDEFENEIWMDLPENSSEKDLILNHYEIPLEEYSNFLMAWRTKRNIWSHLDKVLIGPQKNEKKIVRDLKYFLEMDGKTPDQLISEIGTTIKFLSSRDDTIQGKTNAEVGTHFLNLSDNKHKSLQKAESIRYRYGLLDWKAYVPVKAIDQAGEEMVGIEGLRAELAGEKGLTNVVEISGLGGLGKSALVQHYIYRSITEEYPEFEEYSDYYFFTAKTEEQGDWETDYHVRKLGNRTQNPREFARGMGDFSQGLLFDNFLRRLAPSGTMDPKAKVLKILQQNRILVVLDNYEDVHPDEKKKYKDFFSDLGRECQSRIIITGRPMEKSRHAKIILQNMDSKEATELMINRFEYLYGQNNKSWISRNQDLETLLEYRRGDGNLVEDIEKTLEGREQSIFKEIRGHPGVLMYIVSLLGSKEIRDELNISEKVEFGEYLKKVALDKEYGFDKFNNDMFKWITKKAYDRLIQDPMCKSILNLLSTKSDLTLSDIKEELSERGEENLEAVQPAILDLKNNNHFLIENQENKRYSLHPNSHRFLKELVTSDEGCSFILEHLSTLEVTTSEEIKQSFAMKPGLRADEFDECFDKLVCYDVYLEVDGTAVSITRAGLKAVGREMDHSPTSRPKLHKSENEVLSVSKPSIIENELALQLDDSLSRLPDLHDHESQIEEYLNKSRLPNLAQVDLGTFRTFLDYFIKTEGLVDEDSEYPQRDRLFANVRTKITHEYFQEKRIEQNDIYEISAILILILAEVDPNLALSHLGRLPTYFPGSWLAKDNQNMYEKIYLKLYSNHYSREVFNVPELSDDLWEPWLQFLLFFEESGVVRQKFAYKHMMNIISRHNGQNFTGFGNGFNRMKQVQKFFEKYSHKLPWSNDHLTFLVEIESIHVASGWQEWGEWPRFTIPSTFTPSEFEDLKLGCSVQYRDLLGEVVEPETDREMVCSVQYLSPRRLELRILPHEDQPSQEIEDVVDETVIEFAQNQYQKKSNKAELLIKPTLKDGQKVSSVSNEILEMLHSLIKIMLEESTTNSLLVKNINERFKKMYPGYAAPDLTHYFSSNQWIKAERGFEFTIVNAGRSDETLRCHRRLPGADEDAEEEFKQWFTSYPKRDSKALYPTLSLDSELVIQVLREVQKVVMRKIASSDGTSSVGYANSVKDMVWLNLASQVKPSSQPNVESIAWTLSYHHIANQKDIFADYICIDQLHFEAKRRANLYASKITQAKKKVFDRNIEDWRNDLLALIESESKSKIVISGEKALSEEKEVSPPLVSDELVVITPNLVRRSKLSEPSIIEAVNRGYVLWKSSQNVSFRSIFYRTFKEQTRMNYRRVFGLRIHQDFLSYIVKNIALIHDIDQGNQDFHTCALDSFFEE